MTDTTMKQVSYDDFYAFVAVRDLMPKTDENSLKGRYTISHWEDKGRNRIGISKSDMHSIDPTEYWIKP